MSIVGMLTPNERTASTDSGYGSTSSGVVAAWVRGSRDPVRDEILTMLREKLADYAAQA